MRLVSDAHPRFRAAVVALILCCGSVGCDFNKQKREALAEGDRLYSTDPAAAVAKYKEGWDAAGPRKAEVLQRVVDHEAKPGNSAEAKKWIEKGLSDKLTVNYETPAARELLAQVQHERGEAEAKKKAEKEAKEKAKKEAEEQRKRYGGESEATTAAQMFVKQNLAFPAEAKFSILGRDTKQNADKSWKVSGEVTSKNAFGVKVKFRFQVTVMRQENGDWREVEPVALTEVG